MKIVIIYNIPPDSIKYTNWHDGFTKAIQLIKDDKLFSIQMINFNDNKYIELNNYDFVFIKWGFGSAMQTFAQNYFKTKKKKCKIGIFISSIKKPSDDEIKFYDIMFYETEWYKIYSDLKRHTNIYHAFGIDSSIMYDMKLEKMYDYIFVGNITGYKRPLNLIRKNGKKLVVGLLSDKKIVNELEDHNIEIKDFVKYHDLAVLYNKSKKCYIPCKIDGGGERAVLEARACNIQIEIENDNPKLKELATSQIYNSEYYAKQIKYGIFNTINMNIKNIVDIYDAYKNSCMCVVQVGAMDGVKFDKLNPFITKNTNIYGYLFEPVKYYYDELVKNYKHYNNIMCINSAISNIDGNIDFNIIDPLKIIQMKLPEFLMGISSIYDNRNALSKNYWSTRGKINTDKFGWTYENIVEKYKTKIKVKSIKASTFLQLYNISKIDLLYVSASGHEYHIINDFLQLLKPKYIKFEYSNIPSDEYKKCELLLTKNNYKFYKYNNQDCIAIYLM